MAFLTLKLSESRRSLHSNSETPVSYLIQKQIVPLKHEIRDDTRTVAVLPPPRKGSSTRQKVIQFPYKYRLSFRVHIANISL